MRYLLALMLAVAVIVPMACQDKKPAQPSPEPPRVTPLPTIEAGITPIPTVSPTPIPTPGGPTGNTYTVKAKDTIYSISRALYGNDKRAKDIIAANPGIDPNKLTVGQVINLPAK